MKKNVLLVFFFVFFFHCSKQKKVSLFFLDEYIVKDSTQFQNTILGGFSGLDFSNNTYYLIVDDAKNPRFVKSNIIIQKDTFSSVQFINTTSLKDATSPFFRENYLDLESIFVDKETQEINFVSEGSIYKNKKPSIFVTDLNGNFKYEYKLPSQFLKLEHIKHNAVFEASSKSSNNKGFWVAMEGVLKSDGDEPTFHKTLSPIRITYFDKKTKKATKQYAYQLEHIYKPAKGNINLNGVTAILEYKENHFFVVERIYQSGYGTYGNIVQIFEAYIDKKTTNILAIDSLKNNSFIPLKKRLLLNFNDIKNKLTDGIVDNIEGITLGPKLANGNQSLVLVADDNFQIYGKQLNQFILLEIDEN